METRTNTEFNAEVDTYLRDDHAVTLSASSSTGLPHANTAPYVSDAERLYFFVRDESILLSNLVDSKRAAFTVDEYGPPCTISTDEHVRVDSHSHRLTAARSTRLG